MDNFSEKVWLQRNLRRTSQRVALELIDELGRALPCKIQAVNGQLVTVNFSVMDTTPFVLSPIEVPVLGSPYFYWPFQVGDTGALVPFDSYIDYIAGLTETVPNILPRPANLSALLFVPVGKASFVPVNANAVQLQGPDGVICQTSDGSVSMTTDTSGVTIKAFGNTWTFNKSGFTMSTGTVAETHIHSDPQGGVTGPPEA